MSADASSDEVQHIFRWDLDKTYLHTDFDTWIDLVRTAIEVPEKKRSVPGAAVLIRELRASLRAYVTILSGSPEQMRSSLEMKLRLDGVQWDEFILKPSLRHIVRFRFRAIRDQVGYKLPALLRARIGAPAHVPETLFGDDAEADALVYSLYADVLAGKVDNKLLTAVLEEARCYPDVIGQIIELVEKVPRTGPVKRIFIHRERRSDPEFFRRYGPRVIPMDGYLQGAVMLMTDGLLTPRAVLRVANVLAAEPQHLAGQLAALVQRGHVAPAALAPVREALDAPDHGVREALHAAFVAQLDALPEQGEAIPEVEIDYLSSLTVDRARWEAARAEARQDRRAKKR